MFLGETSVTVTPTVTKTKPRETKPRECQGWITIVRLGQSDEAEHKPPFPAHPFKVMHTTDRTGPYRLQKGTSS